MACLLICIICIQLCTWWEWGIRHGTYHCKENVSSCVTYACGKHKRNMWGYMRKASFDSGMSSQTWLRGRLSLILISCTVDSVEWISLTCLFFFPLALSGNFFSWLDRWNALGRGQFGGWIGDIRRSVSPMAHYLVSRHTILVKSRRVLACKRFSGAGITLCKHGGLRKWKSG